MSIRVWVSPGAHVVFEQSPTRAPENAIDVGDGRYRTEVFGYPQRIGNRNSLTNRDHYKGQEGLGSHTMYQYYIFEIHLFFPFSTTLKVAGVFSRNCHMQ